MTANAFDKVLIIGAGLGGLMLAQMLQYKGIPFEIFERDAAPSGRKQGWAVSIVEGLDAADGMIPPELYKKFSSISVNHNTGEFDEFAFVDAHTGKVAAKIGGLPPGKATAFIRANREGFRKLLWESEGLPVAASKQFVRYEEDNDGVTAFFKDGTTARGSLLIGGDGLSSHVTDQLVGDSHKPELSSYVPLFGEVDLTPEQYKPYLELANAGVIISGPRMRFMVGMLAMEDDKSSARFFWSLATRADNPQELFDFIQHSDSQQRYDFAIKRTKEVEPSLTELLRIGGPNAVLPYQPAFKEFVTPSDLPTGRVTILGDAAHGMIPFRGAGANTAILDAADLAHLLIEARDDGTDPKEIVAPYHAKMIPRGREAVLSSRSAGEPAGDDPVAFFATFQKNRKQKE